MTLTAAQQEIVRRFVEGERLSPLAYELIHSDYRVRENIQVPMHTLVESWIRAALLEKDAEIERLRNTYEYNRRLDLP